MINKNITNFNKKNILVDIIPIGNFDKFFTYKLETIGNKNYIGHRVSVTLNKRRVVGIIAQEHKDKLEFDESKLKNVTQILDDKPIISNELIELCKWISDYYLTPLGEVLKSVIPSRLLGIQTKYVHFLGISRFAKEILTNPEHKIVNYLQNSKGLVSINTLRNKLKISNIEKILESLEFKGILKVRSKSIGKIPQKTVIQINPIMFEQVRFQDYIDILKRRKKIIELLNFLLEQAKLGKTEVDLEILKNEFPNVNISKNLKEIIELGFISLSNIDNTDIETSYQKLYNYPNELQLPLNKQQKSVLEEILPSLENQKYCSFLLFGITGSGKTLIYLHCIEKCLALGKSAIVLVPEISLTPQFIERFNNAFPEQIAVLHSRLKENERIRQWVSILNGEKKIVIGARSAIFAPTPNLGLIIVDEEHEPSYKQEEPAPRYQARDTALIRGKIQKCVVILGSATPSVNSYYGSKKGKHKMLVIDQRADGANLPNILLVDMLEKRKNKKVFGQFSDTMIHKIIERITQREGIILFQNRRGFGLLVECRFCGYIPKCPECEVSLTFHKSDQMLKCHYCGFEVKFNVNCPRCGKFPIMILGYGTQRVEEELEKILNEFGYSPKIDRFDLDIVQKNPRQTEILKKFYFGEIDILVGTQLIAKGLDFERVTLVGIINADLQLNVPDYTACERAFQLFTQVAGRAGRRSGTKGEVIIQTSTPNTYPIEAFIKNDFEFFFQKEIKFRNELHYPPFYRLISIEIQWKGKIVDQSCFPFAENNLKTIPNSIILGPISPIIPRVRGWNRKVILIKVDRAKDQTLKKTILNLKKFKDNFLKKYQSKNIRLIIDVDSQFSLI